MTEKPEPPPQSSMAFAAAMLKAGAIIVPLFWALCGLVPD